MFFKQRIAVKREPCRRCLIIRMFLMMVVGVICLGILGGDSLRHFGGLTPSFFGWAFAALGVGFFILRFVLWRMGRLD